MTRRPVLLLLFFGLAPLLQAGQQTKPEDAVHQFVQDFYRWYRPIAEKDNKEAADIIAIKQRPSAFSPQLLQALRDDAAAQAKSADLVGLEFDPFLNTQETIRYFGIGQITKKDDGYWVEINSSVSEKPDRKPFIAVVNQSGGHWCFVNFRYPDDNSDLLKILESLKHERQRSPSSSH
jgi:hypothetical protein